MSTVTIRAALAVALAAAMGVGCSAPPQQTSTPAAPAGGIDRTVLPIAEPNYPLATELDARNAKPPARFEVKAPERSPNVIIFLIDDIGFGHPATFGGQIPMPTLDRLASQGLKYNRFHTTALCSPTRVALLTGRNHHTNNAGAIMEVATAFPGNTGARPQSVTPLAEILRQNGYSTGAFGKYHETAPWEVSVSGPFDRWPTQSGFDKFYGFIGGETNQWAPLIFDGTIKIEPPHDPNYHFTTDMTNQAIRWIRSQQALTPDKPFFTYFATGATHAPHHVPKEWIDKFRGKFDAGWDMYREETFARQKKLGIIPENTKLAARPADIKAWAALSADEKRLFARQMEVFAAFAAHTDYEIGRVVKAIEDLGELDNTLIIYEVGDNGASAEGGMFGMFNEMTYFNGVAEIRARHAQEHRQVGRARDLPAHGGGLGGGRQYALHVDQAGGLQLRRYPQPAGDQLAGADQGQGRDPQPVPARGGYRADRARSRQHSGAEDGQRRGPDADGRRQHGLHLRRSKAVGRHKTQYFEIFGNRAIYSDGWVAATVHKAPWEAEPRRGLAEDVWELYNVDEDFSESTDLAASNPAKLKELQALFMKEAERYRVLPIDDRVLVRFDPAAAGRPDLMAGRKTLTRL